MAVEMTATRLLQPYYGSSIYTWTNVVAVILAGLAAGYFLGGRLADRRPEQRILGWILLGGGCLVALVPLASSPVQRLFVPEPGALPPGGLPVAVVAGSLASTLILFAAPVLVLGAVAPFAVKLLTEAGQPPGTASGLVLMVSTLGSILGTFLPAHVTVPWLGTRVTFLLAAATLLLTGALNLARRPGAAVALLGAAVLVPIAIASALRGEPVRPAAGLLDERDSAYQYVQVVEGT